MADTELALEDESVPVENRGDQPKRARRSDQLDQQPTAGTPLFQNGRLHSAACYQVLWTMKCFVGGHGPRNPATFLPFEVS